MPGCLEAEVACAAAFERHSDTIESRDKAQYCSNRKFYHERYEPPIEREWGLFVGYLTAVPEIAIMIT